MKNLRFISGLVLGLVSGVLLVIGLRCTTGPDIENQIKPDSIVMMKGIDGHFSCGAYKMTIDNIEYIGGNQIEEIDSILTPKSLSELTDVWPMEMYRLNNDYKVVIPKIEIEGLIYE